MPLRLIDKIEYANASIVPPPFCEKIADKLLSPARNFFGRTYKLETNPNSQILRPCENLLKHRQLIWKIIDAILIPFATLLGLSLKFLFLKFNPQQSKKYSLRIENTVEVPQIPEQQQVKLLCSNILKDLEAHKGQLANYPQAKQTITSLSILYEVQSQLDRPTLTTRVKELTGLLIHAADNYPTIEVFRNALADALAALKHAYSGIQNDNDRIRFLQCSLRYNGCLEGRVEEILDYSYSIKTIFGLLKYECQLFNLQNGLPQRQAVHIDDLFQFLKSKNFFALCGKEYGLKEDNFLKLPEIDKLVAKSLLGTSQLGIMNRILESFDIYTDFGTGMENFKKYLLEYCDLKLAERQNIDQAIADFCKAHPNKAAFI